MIRYEKNSVYRRQERKSNAETGQGRPNGTPPRARTPTTPTPPRATGTGGARRGVLEGVADGGFGASAEYRYK